MTTGREKTRKMDATRSDKRTCVCVFRIENAVLNKNETVHNIFGKNVLDETAEHVSCYNII